MLFGKEKDLLVDEAPVTGIFADCDDGDEYSRSGGKIRRLELSATEDLAG